MQASKDVRIFDHGDLKTQEEEKSLIFDQIEEKAITY